MSLPVKRKISTTSPKLLCEDGQKTIKLNLQLPTEDIDDILFPTLVPLISSSIAASLPPSKRKTSSDKLNLCKSDIPIISSCKTSEAHLISNENIFCPFYNKFSKEMFPKLWSPPLTDSFDLTSISLNGFASNMDVNSRLYEEPLINHQNKSSLKTSYQLLQSLSPEITEEEDTVIRSRKIRIWPDEEQKNFFEKCFGTTRYLYNKTICAFKKEIEDKKNLALESAKNTGCLGIIKTVKIVKCKSKTSGSKTNNTKKQKTKKVITEKQCCRNLENDFFCKEHIKSNLPYSVSTNFIYWKKKMVPSNTQLSEKEKWIIDIPVDTRELVIKNVMGGIKSAFTNLIRGNITHFDMKYRSKALSPKLFYVDRRVLKKDMKLWRKLENPLFMKRKDRKWVKNLMKRNADNDEEMKNMIINKDRCGKYYIQIPYNHERQKITKKQKGKIVAIDPGIINFHTFYSPNGKCGKIGENFAKSIHTNLITKTDKLKSTIDNRNNEMKEKKKIRKEKIKEVALIEDEIKKLTNESKKRNLQKQVLKIHKEKKALKKEISKLKRSIKKRREIVLKQNAHVRNKVTDLHRKTIKYYCENYEYIILPDFDGVRIAKLLKRQGMPQECRKVLEISHSKLRERLKTKVEMYEGVKLLIGTEEYTSKTCGKCGRIETEKKERASGTKTKRNRIVECVKCKIEVDRDINAARNILILNATKKENGVDGIPKKSNQMYTFV